MSPSSPTNLMEAIEPLVPSLGRVDLLRYTFLRGRVAQSAILRVLGVQAGDEVAIQAFTCSAVVEAVLSVGAKPVYVDTGPEPDCFTMDPGDLAAKLTDRTRAIVVQHTFGIPADMAAIGEVADARGLPIVEDCAHAMGSTWQGKILGTLGAASFFSFEASKPVFIGIGGSAWINDDPLEARLHVQYRNYTEPGTLAQGQVLAMFLAHRVVYRPSTFWTVRSIFRKAVRLGVIPGNYHDVTDDTRPADDFRRAMGRMQRHVLRHALRSIEANLTHRSRVASQYRSRIPSKVVRHPHVPSRGQAVFGRYPLLTTRKEEFLSRAARLRLELADWYATPVHALEGAALEAVGYRAGSCPNAEGLTRRVLSLPTSARVTDAQIERAQRLFTAS